MQYPEAKAQNIRTVLEEMKKAEDMLEKYRAQFDEAPDAVDTTELDEQIKEYHQQLGELRQKNETCVFSHSPVA
ncbi:hypothetical protein DI43_10575 [Geobacillus sp. CAMR12739]|nr:hypothetical protein DI43_10575 [Geobacillus sp. CAMR12739]